MICVQENQSDNFTVKLMEKTARLQVLSPVKRVVFPFFDRYVYNNYINFLTKSDYIW